MEKQSNSLESSPKYVSSPDSSRDCELNKKGADEAVLTDAEHLLRLKQIPQRGRIELIMGPMFAGKSTELLRRVKRLEISGKRCLSVKYSADQRYSTHSISTHDQ